MKQGAFIRLWTKLDLLTDKQTAIFGEDLERIAEKLDHFKKAEDRKNGMVWRH